MRYRVGIAPESETRILRPRGLVAAVERIGLRLPLGSLSEGVIYVCSRSAEGAWSGG